MKRIAWMVIPMTIALQGCTWVKTTDAGAAVTVATFDHVKACKKLGKVTVNVLDRVGFIARSEEQVAKELQTMAKNSAAEMDGDTVVAVSRVIDGEQAFNVYRCGK